MPTIRFHLDESAPLAVATALRLRGIDVSIPHETDLLNADDLAHLHFASEEGRVVFTQDADFLVYHSQGIHHPGIVYCKQQSRTIGQMVRSLSLLWEIVDASEMVDHVEFI
jgi:predicted nuclease of predicted toxin-antitoxin system